MIRRRTLPTNLPGMPEAIELHVRGCPVTLTFETPSGGAVFSTGSISWICCLPVDSDISTITFAAALRTRDDSSSAIPVSSPPPIFVEPS